MKIKRVNRYYCDFCNKGGCAAGHMKNHEKHCTMNPHRVCRVCHRWDGLGNGKSLMTILNQLQTDVNDFKGKSWVNIEPVKQILLNKIQNLTQGCPVCVLSVLRQFNIAASFIYEFRFKESLEEYRKARQFQVP